MLVLRMSPEVQLMRPPAAVANVAAPNDFSPPFRVNVLALSTSTLGPEREPPLQLLAPPRRVIAPLPVRLPLLSSSPLTLAPRPFTLRLPPLIANDPCRSDAVVAPVRASEPPDVIVRLLLASLNRASTVRESLRVIEAPATRLR